MARPAVFTVLSVGLLVASPCPTSISTAARPASKRCPPSDVKTAYEVLGRDFSVGLASPVEIVVDGDTSNLGVQASIAALQQALDDGSEFRSEHGAGQPDPVTWR